MGNTYRTFCKSFWPCFDRLVFHARERTCVRFHLTRDCGAFLLANGSFSEAVVIVMQRFMARGHQDDVSRSRERVWRSVKNNKLRTVVIILTIILSSTRIVFRMLEMVLACSGTCVS